MGRPRKMDAVETEETVFNQATEVAEDVKAEAKVAIPADVDKLLHIYSNYEELYITKAGGVFIAKPQPNIEAIHYKNPYYKS